LAQHSLTSFVFGGSADETINAAAVDAAGNICVVGTTFSFDFPLRDAVQSANGGTQVFGTPFPSATPLQPLAIAVPIPRASVWPRANQVCKSTDGGEHFHCAATDADILLIGGPGRHGRGRQRAPRSCNASRTLCNLPGPQDALSRNESLFARGNDARIASTAGCAGLGRCMSHKLRKKSHSSAGVALAAASLFGLLIGTAGCASTSDAKGLKGRGRGRGEGAMPVLVARAVQRAVPVEIEVVGNIEAYSTISVKAQVNGELTRVHFHEGDFVKAGQPLFTIDPRPFEAQLHQAQANLMKDTALLGQAEANLAKDIAQEKYARAEAARYARLFQEGVISKEQSDQMATSADTITQTVAADRATIESTRAQIAADKATVDNAEVQLSYTNITSPINGRTGNLSVKQGNVVPANTTELVTITQIEPIYATFNIPEDQLPDVKRYMALGKLQVVAQPQNDARSSETGVLTFVDNAVDPTTGSIKLKGTFANTDHKLWPGQFVRVTLRLTTQPDAVVVPNQAVQTGQNGSYVYVVKANRTVELRPVTTGSRIDQDLVIARGLEAGETVVTEGQLRLTPGSHVQIRDGAAPGTHGGTGARRRNRPPV
jgi:membrane fusion protein, multidrug efflux system